MKNLKDKINSSYLFGRVFHTSKYCLQEALKDCKSVLDLGCGQSSPLQYCKNIKYSVGVEPYVPYIEKSKKEKIHSEYINDRLENVSFPQKSFDAVILIGVIEHLEKNNGNDIIKKAEIWAKKKVIVSMPNGFFPQEEVDGNNLQKHISAWEVKEMKGFGYKCWGLEGVRFLRCEVDYNSASGDIFPSIRFQPKIFWVAIATLSQLITYYFSQSAFELFCVKQIKK